jgi:nucleotide-binding universal stress UspA family protein
MNVFRRVLVPLDGSDDSERALVRAIAIAAEQQAEIHFVHVIEGVRALPGFDEVEHAMHAAGASLLDHAVALACVNDLLGSSTVLVTNERRRSVAQQILCEATIIAADLIGCGAHGIGERTNLLLGSVADELVRQGRFSLMLEHADLAARAGQNGWAARHSPCLVRSCWPRSEFNRAPGTACAGCLSER